jgi:hypothetical protein
VVAAHLRAPNIRLAAYLDDWFVVNQNKQMLKVLKKELLLPEFDLMVSNEKEGVTGLVA